MFRVSISSKLLVCFVLCGAPLGAASWTRVTNSAPGTAGTMILLSDGTVLVQQNYQGSAFMKLKPDSTGSYINGTWTTTAPMATDRLYYASQILPSGKLWVLGGEYSGASLAQNWTNLAELYNPVTNTWTAAATFPQSQFGDDPTSLISSTQILAGYLSGPQTYIYNIATNSWSQTGTKLRNDRSDEEGFVKLPDGSVLSYDIFSSVSAGNGFAQRYVPGSGAWVDASLGTIPVLSSSAVGFELGPQLRLLDGRVLVLGANQHSAIYTPSSNSWVAGPDISDGSATSYGADDAPAAILPNGHVIFAADTPLFNKPTKLFDFNPATNTISALSPTIATANMNGNAAFITRMLVLPTGQVLFSDNSAVLWVYTPDTLNAAIQYRPVINSIVNNNDGTYTLTGKQLNGQSAGAAYGDDAEMDENYPILRMTNAAGTVYYCRTSNWSLVGVATGTTPETVTFTLDPTMPSGNYSAVVSGAGISSLPMAVSITVPVLQ